MSEESVEALLKAIRNNGERWADAECLKIPIESWDWKSMYRVDEVKRDICSRCPLIEQCRIEGDDFEKDVTFSLWYGVWGGEGVKDRVERRGVHMEGANKYCNFDHKRTKQNTEIRFEGNTAYRACLVCTGEVEE